MRKQPLSGRSYPPSASISTAMSIEMSDASTKLEGKDGDVADDGAVDGAEVAAEVEDGVVDGAEVAAEVEDGAMDGAEVVDGVIGGAEVVDGGVDGADVVDSAMDGEEVVNGAVDGAEVVGGAMNVAEVVDGAMDSAEVVDGAMDGAEVAAEVVDVFVGCFFLLAVCLRFSICFLHCLGLVFLVFPCGADPGVVHTYSAMAASRSSVHEIRRR